jgi:hypothetical protein
MKTLRNLLCGLSFCCLSLVGCGGTPGPELGEVTGKVLLDGEPVVGATLTFIPEGPNGSPSYGKTDANGVYTLNFTNVKSGAMIGRHEVSVESGKQLSKADIEDLKAAGETVPEVSSVKVPKKYKGKGALTAEVKAGKNTVDFALDSK